MYITSRFDGSSENEKEINRLCSAIRKAGIEDFHVIRDMVGPFTDQKDLWNTARKYINECDAMLVDISDKPSGGRLVEIGIAFALNKPIYVIVKEGIEFKDFYNGIATSIFKYNEIEDITKQLKSSRNTSTSLSQA